MLLRNGLDVRDVCAEVTGERDDVREVVRRLWKVEPR